MSPALKWALDWKSRVLGCRAEEWPAQVKIVIPASGSISRSKNHSDLKLSSPFVRTITCRDRPGWPVFCHTNTQRPIPFSNILKGGRMVAIRRRIQRWELEQERTLSVFLRRSQYRMAESAAALICALSVTSFVAYRSIRWTFRTAWTGWMALIGLLVVGPRLVKKVSPGVEVDIEPHPSEATFFRSF